MKAGLCLWSLGEMFCSFPDPEPSAEQTYSRLFPCAAEQMFSNPPFHWGCTKYLWNRSFLCVVCVPALGTVPHLTSLRLCSLSPRPMWLPDWDTLATEISRLTAGHTQLLLMPGFFFPFSSLFVFLYPPLFLSLLSLSLLSILGGEGETPWVYLVTFPVILKGCLLLLISISRFVHKWEGLCVNLNTLMLKTRQFIKIYIYIFSCIYANWKCVQLPNLSL